MSINSTSPDHKISFAIKTNASTIHKAIQADVSTLQNTELTYNPKTDILNIEITDSDLLSLFKNQRIISDKVLIVEKSIRYCDTQIKKEEQG